jgi:hypothetical protein
MNDVMENPSPTSETEACCLRPYIPTATLVACRKLVHEACAESEKLNAKHDKVEHDLRLAKIAASEAVKKVNALKRELAKLPYVSSFSKYDPARQAAWAEARIARAAAIAAGEPLKYETGEQATARMEGRPA